MRDLVPGRLQRQPDALAGRGAQGGGREVAGRWRGGPEEPRSAALRFEGSSHPENQDPGSRFYVSDATDCSLPLDC